MVYPQSEKEIFYEAIAIAQNEIRDEYLSLACDGDEGLRHRVESLLKVAAGDFMRTRAVDCIAAERESERRIDDAARAIEAPAAREFARSFDPADAGEPSSSARIEVDADANTPNEYFRGTTHARSDGISSKFNGGSLVGQMLGHYYVVWLIGSGGMGQVYRAEDRRLGRKVALKVIPPKWKNDRPLHSLREAELASALNHPNVCPIYDVGECSGWCFIAMQYIDGQTLDELVNGKPLALDRLLAIALEVADALSTAHQQGIVHCDVKPRNIMINLRGQAIMLDFGLARLFTAEHTDASRMEGVVGTPAFMSPEQARGVGVDCRSDIFSFGVVLYYMATGAVPFRGASSVAVMHEVIAEPHVPPRERNAHLPPELASIIDRAMAKSPEARYQSVDEFASDLLAVQSKFSLPAQRELARRRRRRMLSAAALAATVAVALGWTALQAMNRSWARRQLPEIERLVDQGKTLEAYDLAVRVREILPGKEAAARWTEFQSMVRSWATQQLPVIENLVEEGRTKEAFDLMVRIREILPRDEPKLIRLMRITSDTLSVKSDPPGAEVYLKRFEGPSAGGASPEIFVGVTPIIEYEVPRGDYLVRIQKVGYALRQRTWSTGPVLDVTSPATLPSLPIDVKLTPERDLPPGMVLVPGGKYRLHAWRRPTDENVPLDDYYIDQCEVTNREYQEFVDAGGYLDERYWSVPFVEADRELSRSEAMARLVDKSGNPGPRGWSNQKYPEGMADHPVTGVTWYEAAAYARWREKSLPTVFQWERAARDGEPYGGLFLQMPWGPFVGPIGRQLNPLGQEVGPTDGRANFYSGGTVPVGSLEFGMSPFGCYEMAGDVAEWCVNPASDGHLVCGGSYSSAAYEFGYYGPRPSFYESDKLGFRCVKNLSEVRDQGAMPLPFDDMTPQYSPEPAEKVRAHFPRYAYDVAAPLNAQVVDVVETDDWSREEIEYLGYKSKPRRALLFRPKRFPPPHQVIHFVPAGDVGSRLRSLPQSIEADCARFVHSGRALFAVMRDEYLGGEGPPAWELPPPHTAEFVDDVVVPRSTDMRRGLDYLETRSDLDASRIAYYHASPGGFPMSYLAVEDRYAAIVLQGAGIRNVEVTVRPAANPIDFAPLIRAPKLLVAGKYDEAIYFATEAMPLYNLFSDNKKLIPYDGGHRPEPDELQERVNPWLDDTLGPVTPSPAQE
jgi:formylglycine-generating enzyme required for sulfatase activity/predicted Ser/Thr protein kinase